MCGGGGNMSGQSNMLLELFKRAGAVRKFIDRTIPDDFIKLILESGTWGISVLGVQPWEIICIKDKQTRIKLATVMLENAPFLPRPFEVVTRITAEILKNAGLAIAIYDTEAISNRAQRQGLQGTLAEMQSISTAIHNMHLMAFELGLGSVWADSPSFVEQNINPILKINKKLIAFLLIGYPAETIKRSKRTQPLSEIKII